MLPPAPERFSTMTGLPKSSCRRCATMRASRSAEPPAANGTTIVTARSGQASAFACSIGSTFTGAAMPGLAEAPMPGGNAGKLPGRGGIGAPGFGGPATPGGGGGKLPGRSGMATPAFGGAGMLGCAGGVTPEFAGAEVPEFTGLASSARAATVNASMPATTVAAAKLLKTRSVIHSPFLHVVSTSGPSAPAETGRRAIPDRP